MQTCRTGKLAGCHNDDRPGDPARPPGTSGPRASAGTVSTDRRGRERVHGWTLQDVARKPDAPRPPTLPTLARGAGPGWGTSTTSFARYRRELHVYCYRMLGSFDEAEDHVQEVLLRAWRSRDRFQGRSSPRTWLYRLATNACLDTLRAVTPGGPCLRRPALRQLGPSIAAMPWVQPYPDSLLDEVAADQTGAGGSGGEPRDDLARLSGRDSAAATAPARRADPAQRGQLACRRGRRAARHERPGGRRALRAPRATLRDQWRPDGGWTGHRRPSPIPGSAACSSASSPRMNKPTRRR